MLLYALLHLTGYDLSLDDLKQFRQWNSRTPGHPEYHETPGVEMTTGPLGQGFAGAVGMAIAERWLATKFNREGFPIVDHYTYVLAGDGDLMEGIVHEAASLAGHLRLGKLIVVYDSNGMTLAGPTTMAWSEDVGMRFAAYGWHVVHADGHSMDSVANALEEARADVQRPSLIITRTIIGYGSLRAGSQKAHAGAFRDDEVAATKAALGWPVEPAFFVPQAVYDHMRRALDIGEARYQEWEAMLGRYRLAYPDAAAEWDVMQQGGLPEDWEKAIPFFPPDPQAKGTRVASGVVLQALAPVLPGLVSSSVDVHTEDYTYLEGYGSIDGTTFAARNLHVGVRDHAMAALLNGMALHGGIIPYGGNFLSFSDYMLPAMRLAAMMRLRVIYVFIHDSIGAGEDGPTHQPVEHLVSLRAIPNMWVIRPADANEVAVAWRIALQRTDGPTALICSRQGVPTLDRQMLGSAEGVARGGYVLRDTDSARAIIIATGSEVSLALAAADHLASEGIAVRVVSMPCRELFDRQDADYRESVLPSTIRVRVAVEAARSIGWDRYVGCQGAVIGIDHFGASAPYQRLYAEFGLTVDRIAAVVRDLLAASAGSNA